MSRHSQTAPGSLVEKANAASETFEDVPRGEHDLAGILYTSGTTGRSKGAMVTHRNLLSNAQALVEAWQFTDQDVLLHALPIFHTHGLFVATNTILLAGGSMIFLPKFDLETSVCRVASGDLDDGRSYLLHAATWIAGLYT